LLLPSARPAPTSPLFPYTTLFRSDGPGVFDGIVVPPFLEVCCLRSSKPHLKMVRASAVGWDGCRGRPLVGMPPRPAGSFGRITRSEEHTSELQSRFDLVCRLLLDK